MFALPAINIFVIVMFLLFIIKYCINKFIKSNNEKVEVEKEDDEDLENYLNREKYYDNILSELERMNVEVQNKDSSYEDEDLVNYLSFEDDYKDEDEYLGDYLSCEKYFSELERTNVEVQSENFSYEDSDIKTNMASRNSITDINNNEKTDKNSHEEETDVKEQVKSVNNARKITIL